MYSNRTARKAALRHPTPRPAVASPPAFTHSPGRTLVPLVQTKLRAHPQTPAPGATSLQAISQPKTNTAECRHWLDDPQSLSKQVAEHYVTSDVVPPIQSTVATTDCQPPIASGAYGCVVRFGDGTAIRVIVRSDVIIAGFYPITTMTPPKEQPLCFYDYHCPPPSGELALSKRECKSA